MKVLRLSWTLNNFKISFLKLLDGIPYVRSCLLCHLSNSSYDQYLDYLFITLYRTCGTLSRDAKKISHLQCHARSHCKFVTWSNVWNQSNVTLSTHESFGNMGKGLMKVTYFNKRLWNVCGCRNLIIELPIINNSIINYFPCIVGYMQSNHVGNHLWL
jgi:hypothetical protein